MEENGSSALVAGRAGTGRRRAASRGWGRAVGGPGARARGAGGRLAGAVPPSARAGEGGRRRVALPLALGVAGSG